MTDKQDSNSTGLRYAEADATGMIYESPAPTWYGLEPNEYDDFGADISQVARKPINEGRQRKRGKIVDLEASAGWTADLVDIGIRRLYRGLFISDFDETPTTAPMAQGGTTVTITAVDGAAEQYEAASGLNIFLVNSLIFASGFTDNANNGLKLVSAVAAGAVDVSGSNLVTEVPPAGAKLEMVGYQFASATLDVDIDDATFPRLKRASGVFDFTTLPLSVGQWIFVGGDSAALRFNTAANSFWGRIRAIAASYIEFDKTSSDLANETGTGKTVQIFFGHFIKNQKLRANQVRQYYWFERTLGEDDDGTQAEYVKKALIDEAVIEIPGQDKATIQMTAVGTDVTHRTGLEGVWPGSRPDIPIEDAFNTSSDVKRLKIAAVSATDPNPDPYFRYVEELSVTIANGINPNKAVSVLGAFDQTLGTFEVDAETNAFFATVAGSIAIRNNTEATLDMILVRDNVGIVFDLPSVTLSGGQNDVEQDEAIMVPLEILAGECPNGYTASVGFFPYLPALVG